MFFSSRWVTKIFGLNDRICAFVIPGYLKQYYLTRPNLPNRASEVLPVRFCSESQS